MNMSILFFSFSSILLPVTVDLCLTLILSESELRTGNYLLLLINPTYTLEDKQETNTWKTFKFNKIH